MKRLNHIVHALLLACCPLALQPAQADPSTDISVDAQGVIRGAAPAVGLSPYLSPEAHTALLGALKSASQPSSTATDIARVRSISDAESKSVVEKWLSIYPATIAETRWNGVHVQIVTPKKGIDPANSARVLINLHMGRFITGARFGGLAEAVPLAGRGRIRVVAVDYRLAPEAGFPAALEDLEAVYRYALTQIPAQNIGIYGCSAGGALAAQSVVWFSKRGLPLPGALGLFCSGAMPGFWRGGESDVTAFWLSAVAPSPGPTFEGKPLRGYFAATDARDPLIGPASFPDILAKFPPVLLVTGTRDVALSNALTTHAHLLQAGRDSELFVQEGLGHGQFINFPGTPEAELAYEVIWKFFDRRLGKTR